ncbi:MAG: hypothetical protein ACLUR5_09060 [Eubacterium ventriosum]
MMQVVMTLAGAENGGSANIVVVIIGNIIVMAMGRFSCWYSGSSS